jgi:hypothetical protein
MLPVHVVLIHTPLSAAQLLAATQMWDVPLTHASPAVCLQATMTSCIPTEQPDSSGMNVGGVSVQNNYTLHIMMMLGVARGFVG